MVRGERGSRNGLRCFCFAYLSKFVETAKKIEQNFMRRFVDLWIIF
jgi:hypothetical protein